MNRHLDRLHEANNNLFDGLAKSDEPTCCFCIPIRIGIILIGLISLFDCFQFVMLANNMAPISTIVMVFYYIALVPAVVGFLIFLRYFINGVPPVPVIVEPPLPKGFFICDCLWI